MKLLLPLALALALVACAGSTSPTPTPSPAPFQTYAPPTNCEDAITLIVSVDPNYADFLVEHGGGTEEQQARALKEQLLYSAAKDYAIKNHCG